MRVGAVKRWLAKTLDGEPAQITDWARERKEIKGAASEKNQKGGI